MLFLIGLSVYIIGLLYSSLMGAPYVPTSKKNIHDILMKAHLKKGQIFLELGSGDGRIVREAVKKHGVRGIGVDINLLLIFLSRILAKRNHIENITFKKENIFQTDLSKAEVIYFFLMPELIRKIIPRFEKEINKGTLLISHGFKIPGWEGKLIDQIDTQPFSTFFYRR